MAKVRVGYVGYIEKEIEIDDKYLKLEIDRNATINENDTVYKKEFVSTDIEVDCVEEIANKIGVWYEDICCIEDLDTQSMIYES